MKKMLIIFSVLMIFISSAYAGFGVSVENRQTPLDSDIDFLSMMRGGYSETFIHLSSSNPGTTVCDITVSGEIADWVTFEPGNTVSIMQNNVTKVRMIVNLPEDIANGIYTGKVLVMASSKEAEDGDYAMGISTGVSLRAKIEVIGEQIYAFNVKKIEIFDTEETIPVKLSLTLENTGNVAVRPKVLVKITDNEGSSSGEFEFSDRTVLPSKTEELVFAIPSNALKIGQYWAEVFVYYDNGSLAKQQKDTFDVFERGAFRIRGELVQVKTQVWASTNEVIKITAVFENTGELITNAKFSGEILLGDAIINLVESEQLSVSPGETIELTTHFVPKSSGRYVVSGFVVYSEKITETKSSIVNVNDPGAVPLNTTMLAIVFAIIVLIGLWVFRGKLKKIVKKGVAN